MLYFTINMPAYHLLLLSRSPARPFPGFRLAQSKHSIEKLILCQPDEIHRVSAGRSDGGTTHIARIMLAKLKFLKKGGVDRISAF
jgi:hypothetical protein